MSRTSGARRHSRQNGPRREHEPAAHDGGHDLLEGHEARARLAAAEREHLSGARESRRELDGAAREHAHAPERLAAREDARLAEQVGPLRGRRVRRLGRVGPHRLRPAVVAKLERRADETGELVADPLDARGLVALELGRRVTDVRLHRGDALVQAREHVPVEALGVVNLGAARLVARAAAARVGAVGLGVLEPVDHVLPRGAQLVELAQLPAHDGRVHLAREVPLKVRAKRRVGAELDG